MIYISEKIIDSVLNEFENNEHSLEHAFDAMIIQQSDLLYFLHESIEGVFSKDEQVLIQFVVAVLFKSILKEASFIGAISPEEIEYIDGQNWDVIERSTGGSFRKIVTGFFEGYAQEDLLVFIEDSLMEDENSFVTDDSRLPMFVLLKTILDSFLKKVQV